MAQSSDQLLKWAAAELPALKARLEESQAALERAREALDMRVCVPKGAACGAPA
jgi:hypothetical protein